MSCGTKMGGNGGRNGILGVSGLLEWAGKIWFGSAKIKFRGFAGYPGEEAGAIDNPRNPFKKNWWSRKNLLRLFIIL
jgi:hypothetical protein